MATSIFISLPVKDLKNSTRFYEALGYSRNPQFNGETAACIVICDTIHVMLSNHEIFKELTSKEIADATKVCHALFSLSCESRSAVESLVGKALAAGGSEAHEPEDHGFMYQHGFYDPDGHGWGVFWMDPAAVQHGSQS
jgi:predicted lactoylglutathione lyase